MLDTDLRNAEGRELVEDTCVLVRDLRCAVFERVFS